MKKVNLVDFCDLREIDVDENWICKKILYDEPHEYNYVHINLTELSTQIVNCTDEDIEIAKKLIENFSDTFIYNCDY